jgi:hypothetical protein
MTDHIAEMAERAKLVPMMCQLINLLITDAERARLRRLIADYSPDDPPADLVEACLDMPLFDPRRGAGYEQRRRQRR